MCFRLSVFTALALFASVASAVAQQPVVIAPGTAADVLARMFSFDHNRDTSITTDELPERMRDLVRVHDQNGDGVLVRDEVQRAIERAAASSQAGSVSFDALKTMTLADAIRDLRLPRAQRDRALALTRDRWAWLINRKPKTNDEIMRRLRTLLDDEDYDNLVAAVARIRTITTITVS